MISHRALILDGWNTAIDGHFTLSSYSFGLPSIQEERQEIAGMDGDLDYTDALTGRPVYKTRTLKAMLASTWGTRPERLAIYRELVDHIHGKRCAIGLPDRPGLTAYGRFTVELKTDALTYMEINLTATCDPYLSDGDTQHEQIPLLPANNNLITYQNNIVFLTDYSSCDDASHSAFSSSFSVTEGGIASKAVWEISVLADTDYYIAGRVTGGRGAWYASTDPEAESGSIGHIRTNGTGVIYLHAIKYSQEAFVMQPVTLIQASHIVSLRCGASAAPVQLKFIGTQSGIPSIVLIVNDRLEVYSTLDEEYTLDPGINYAAAVLYRGTASGNVSADWRRLEL